MELTDRELVDAVVRGGEAAFAGLVARYRGLVYQHLASILRDGPGAEDLTQEVFLRLWRQADGWRGEAPFPAWLLRIATNLALNHLRARRRRREQPIEAPPGDEAGDEVAVPSWMVDAAAVAADEALVRQERQRLLRLVVGRLSADKQEVLRLVVEGRLGTREVAAELGIPEGTVKSRLHHARKQIARSWRELGIDWEDLS